MPNNLLSYHDEHMRGNLSAAQRVSPSEISDARQDVLQRDKNGEQGWLRILDDKAHINEVKKALERYKDIKHWLILGVGGSDLGARALLAALRLQNSKTKLYFAGDTTDPEELALVLDSVPWKQVGINVISKSGGTMETMGAFFVACERLEKAVGAKKASERIVCTTDPVDGDLHDLAVQKGYGMLSIPKNIGGRFSVLTSVGLFPLGLAGANIGKLISGASGLRDEWKVETGTGHIIDRYAAWHVAHDRARRQIHVLMPYAASLSSMAAWWRQLWAESLGKSKQRNGQRNYDGPTPIVFTGPTDQHSQLQLYQDGPDDKVYTFLTTDELRTKMRVPIAVKKFSAISYASGKTFSDLLSAAADGTSSALTEAGRPVGNLRLSRINEESLGALIVFFEIATAMAGAMYKINAFDQPGVEASKRRVKELLTNPAAAVHAE